MLLENFAWEIFNFEKLHNTEWCKNMEHDNIFRLICISCHRGTRFVSMKAYMGYADDMIWRVALDTRLIFEEWNGVQNRFTNNHSLSWTSAALSDAIYARARIRTVMKVNDRIFWSHSEKYSA